MSSYAQKLRDPRWQKKRLEVLEAAGWKCERCGDSESTLHVHHKHYFNYREPWEYDKKQLAVLCECCHQSTHDSLDMLLEMISRLDMEGPFGRNEVAWLIRGFVGFGPFPQTSSDLSIALAGQQARDSIKEISPDEFESYKKKWGAV